MKKFLLLLVAVAALTDLSSAQNYSRCATEDEFNKQALNDPSKIQQRQAFETAVQNWINNNPESQKAGGNSTNSVIRVIPVVVHVIYDDICSPVNISKAQIQNQIALLNADYQRLNADTGNTPAGFQSIAANPEIEFRLAQIDPNGNCTDGIVRVQSALTDECSPRDLVKGVSYWNRNSYFNIWVVKAIASQGAAGTVLGYAQFPGGASATDGVVVRSDYFGAIETAASSGNAGRVLTHEVGHWLGLIHIWGDDGGACSGSDNVSDTPNEADQVFGCPSFPVFDACTGSGNGIMFMNYMDYTDGVCQNMFSNGQKSRMNAALTTYRSNLYSNSNLAATGTDGSAQVPCIPVADFCLTTTSVCAGDSAKVTDKSWNSIGINYSWSFPGGSPSTSTLQSPSISYASPGLYDVTLTTTTSAGSDTKTITNAVVVLGAPTAAVLDSQDFELSTSFPGDGIVINPDGGNTWERVTNAGYSGTASIRVNNFSGNVAGQSDKYITPGYNLQNFTSPKIAYKVAHAQRSSTSNEILKVYVSKDCGKNWTLRKTSAGSALATVAINSSNYTPASQADWRAELVSITGQFVNQPNIRVMFENISDAGNNVYIDDINIIGNPTGVEDLTAENVAMEIFPNPASESIQLSFKMPVAEEAMLTIEDISGRTVGIIKNEKMNFGYYLLSYNTSDLSKGIYFVRLRSKQIDVSQKLILQ